MAMLALVAFLPLFASVAANAPIPCSFEDPPTCITVPDTDTDINDDTVIDDNTDDDSSWLADCDSLNEALLNCDQNDVNSIYSWIMCNQNATVLPLLSCAAFVGATNESPFVILHSAGWCTSHWDEEVEAPSGDQADLTPEVCWEQCVALGAAENKTLVAMDYRYMLFPDGAFHEASCYCQDSCPCMDDGGPGHDPLQSSHSILATEFFQAAPTPLPCDCELASFGVQMTEVVCEGEGDSDCSSHVYWDNDRPDCSDIYFDFEQWASNNGTCDDMQSQVLGGSGVLSCNQDETDMVFTYFNCMIAGNEDFDELQAPALDAALNCPTFDGATDAMSSPAFDPFWYDIDCVLTEAPSTDGSGCTAECGTLTNTVETSASGGGNSCPEFTTYECQPGDGDCPAAGTSGSASLGGMAVITTVCLLSYFM